MNKSKNKDVLQVVFSDMHSGSNYALFIDRHWEGKQTSHYPNSRQIAIRAQFEKYADEVNKARKGKKVILVHNGDAIDGDHHNSGDVCSKDPLEQANIHIELMVEFQRKINWQAGDELYYTRGTQTHVNEMENYIGEQLNAVWDGQFYCWNFLSKEINGVLVWYSHSGMARGQGANEGNGIRNSLRNINIECGKDKRRIPHIIFTGHVHDPTYSTYVWREEMTFYTMHGIILPSWQMKTHYANDRVPFSKNKIGGVYQEIKADGTIALPKFCVMIER